MTEYDFSPEAYERYMATQERIARWTESSQQYPPSDPFIMYHSPDSMIQGESTRYHGPMHRHSSDHRGRTRTRPRASTPHRRHSQTPGHTVLQQDPQVGMHINSDLNSPNGTQVPPILASAHSLGSRQNSRSQAPPLATQTSFQADVPALQEHYPVQSPNQPLGLVSHPSSHGSIPQPHIQPPSLHSLTQPVHGYPSHAIIPLSASGHHSHSHYSSRSHSRSPDYFSRNYSDDSYSYRSYSDRTYSRSPSPHRYDHGVIYPSVNMPTIVQPSRSRPIVVPINGGLGGFVVIPPVGQSGHVVDPYEQRHNNNSFLGRLLSPSKWIKTTKRHHRSRRYL